MKKSTFSIPILFCLLFIGGLGSVFAQAFDISSGGLPTITGALGGSVTGSSSTTTNLSVTINFGEVSPKNTNNIVKVVVPIAVRSTSPYKVTATVTGSTNTNPQAIQRTDIGFGANNMHSMGGLLARNCDESPHLFATPFSNDPAGNVMIAANGRVAYLSTLNNVATSTTILSGPELSFLTAARLSNNGYIFNAIFTITPQFYASGTANLTITFTISSGPNVPC
ncbi:MAG TPA: hypothetical protein VGO50_19060 [Pyrinomonadaceae bacterium]|jgi:hypothetical protein|nr:hypothetical protein [Pyrinomonadaceae bacterium]